MIEEHTPAVERAIQAAQSLAANMSKAEVEPDHLLHGLLQEEEGKCYLLLLEAGMQPQQLQEWVMPVEALPSEKVSATAMGISALSVLREARRIAREIAADPVVSSEHLLLALLQEQESLRQPLQERELDFAALEKKIITTIQAPPLTLDEPLELEDAAELIDTARILDANANRAREALRVIEDYCRFVLDEAFFSRELKTMRHQLVAVLDSLSYSNRLAVRDTLRDVGTSLSTQQEQRRYSLREVAEVNLKRLQEALRTLEEYAKLETAAAGQEFEQMRYQCYTLEKMILASEDARARLADVRLYVLVTGGQCWGPLEWTIREAVAGGAQMIQLREKQLTDKELLLRARQVRTWTRGTGSLFIVNDRPDIARLAEADGVHLGQEELPVREARRILGSDAVVGVSTHNLEQLQQALRDGATYVGIGPTFSSQTKQFKELAGLEFVRQASAETSLPAFVIGGVTLANLPEAIEAGAKRAAVSASICRSETPQALARAMRQLLDAAP